MTKSDTPFDPFLIKFSAEKLFRRSTAISSIVMIGFGERCLSMQCIAMSHFQNHNKIPLRCDGRRTEGG